MKKYALKDYDENLLYHLSTLDFSHLKYICIHAQ